MVDVITKTILIETIKESLKKFFSTLNIEKITQEDRERISDALASVQRATIRTRNFIQNNGYEANEELAELWTIALQKSINANIEELPEYLFQKAKFWGKPQDWLKEKSSMELVPKLNYLEEQCECILMRLRKK
jgi:hypothetical protein